VLTWIAIVLIGLIIGWIAAMIADARTARDLLSWVLAGAVGAALGGALLTPWLGGGAIVVSGFSLPNLLLSLLGSVLVPAIALAVRRRGVRPAPIRRPTPNP
jgi:uncharacterized membrane protein YeaQ/YmgE (transglycosylase-associated protein family)